MIKKLQYKFVMIIMGVLLLFIIFLFGAINLFTYQAGELQSKNMMNSIADHDGDMDLRAAGKMPFVIPAVKPPVNFMNIFTIKADRNNRILEIINFRAAKDAESELNTLITSVLLHKKNYGKINNYRYLKKDKPYGTIIVFMDYSAELNQSNRLLMISIAISLISLFVLFFISLFLSRIAIKPVRITFEKQKQFISDASHELKTPISVIQVNADVLESKGGANKWLDFIKSETSRMSLLVNQLLDIARLDNLNHELNLTEFNLSKAAMQIILPFESTAYESMKEYSYNIEDNIIYNGEPEGIKQLLAILIDNALKNSFPKGQVKITLKKHAGKIILEVFNTGNGIDESEKEKIFERFYCSDPSRARESGGYGLGLSIAKAIVTAHHGKITVQSQKGEWAKFIVIFP